MRSSGKFFWGAATSAYQVEGGIVNDWSKFGFNAGRATDHYSRFREDFDLAQSLLGHNAHRFSIEWSRIEPEEGKFNQKEIEHYREVLAALRKRGLEPFVTLWHFTNPIWFLKIGGFASKKSICYFERYTDFVTKNLPDVNFWLTINEPEVYTWNAFWKEKWPPFQKSIFTYLQVFKNLIKAHQAAVSAIKKNNPEAQIGIAKNNSFFEARSKNLLDFLLKKLADYWWNDYFLRAVSGYQDFIGLNYYFHNWIRGLKFNQNENKEVSDLGWEIYPEGLYRVLKGLKKYKKPIYITENGLADAKDEKRAQFIRDHIYWMEKAIAEGVDIRGYFHWSLLDNFEWDKGFDARFGLIEVNYKTMERKIRPSAYIYRDIIKRG